MASKRRTQVQVWRASLALRNDTRRELWSLLSAEERAQADRYKSERDQRRFAAAHGVLRLLLGRYLEVAPAELRFVTGAHGKPGVVTPKRNGDPALRFNLAHSGEMGLFVFAKDREVGVDLEEIDARTARPALAERFFAPGERSSILARTPDERPQYFARLWTLKEAYLKALGLGLTQPLDSFEIGLENDVPRLVAGLNGQHGAVDWTLRELNMGPQYAAALCVEGTDWELCSREWKPSRSV